MDKKLEIENNKLIFKDDRATGLAKTDDVSIFKIMPTDQEIKLCGQKLRTILHPLVEFESEELMLAKKMPRGQRNVSLRDVVAGLQIDFAQFYVNVMTTGV